MRLSTRKDVDRPAETVFAALSDFARLERMLIRRGVAVRPAAGSPQNVNPAPRSPRSENITAGSPPAWDMVFRWRDQPRALHLGLAEAAAPERMTLIGQSDSFDLTLDLTVVALSRDRSRIMVQADVRPRTLRARLMLQTARLGRARIDEQFDRRIRAFLAEATG